MSIPYPIIFIHGLNGTGDSWYDISAYYNSHCNWSWGGEIEFCLEMYDSPGVIQDKCDLSQDVHCFTSSVSSADYYRIEFDCTGSGNCHSGSADPNASNWNSNQAAVIKQGKAIGIAIDKVLNATGKDKVILVGHSMGGLAAREYIQNSSHWLTGSHRVAKLVTSGTPHLGSDYTGFGAGFFSSYDERSEAVRDLRFFYNVSMEHGAYLFANNIYETDAWIKNGLWNYRNVDVNCNGQEGDYLTQGLNDRIMPQNLDLACIVGDEDLIVSSTSSDLFNVYNYLSRLELMTCNDCSHSEISFSNTCLLCVNDYEPIYRTFKALDEPDYLDLAYKVEIGGGWYNGYLTYQDVNHPNPNNDDDCYYFHNVSMSDVYIHFKDLPSNSPLKIYNSSSSTTPIFSTSSNGGVASLLLNNLSSGYYYIKVSGTPYNFPNSGVPAAWDNPYSFYINSSITSNVIEQNIVQKNLKEITNVLGRETKEKKNTPLLYIYDDGTVEKKIIIE